MTKKTDIVRICIKCQVVLTYQNRPKEKGRYVCKSCDAKRIAEYRARNHQKTIDAVRRSRAKYFQTKQELNDYMAMYGRMKRTDPKHRAVYNKYYRDLRKRLRNNDKGTNEPNT